MVVDGGASPVVDTNPDQPGTSKALLLLLSHRQNAQIVAYPPGNIPWAMLI